MTETATTMVAEGTRRSEIVADSADALQLVGLLEGLAELTVVAAIEAFDLTLLSVSGLARPEDAEEWDEVATSLREARARPLGLSPEQLDDLLVPSDLEVLMGILRARFVVRYGRMPRMGKNRDMQVMEGRPHTGGGEGNPVPDETAVLAPRTSVRGRGCRVGVLDTAVFPVAALQGRYLSDDRVDATPPWPKWSGHAAFVAGRILQRAPGAELDVREVLTEEAGTAPAWTVAERMASFLGSGVQILNMSLGGFTADDRPPFLMTRAVERLSGQMMVVASAGNHGNGAPTEAGANSTTSPLWPAALPEVVAVGAADVRPVGSGFEFRDVDFTPQVDWIDLMAPGKDVLSTYLDGEVQLAPDERELFDGWARWSGTSFAAADVTGELASMVQLDGVSPRQALTRLRARDAKGSGHDIRPAG